MEMNTIPIGLMSPRRVPNKAAQTLSIAPIMTPRTMKLYNPGEGSAMKV
jgi:hypothetical protein